MSDLQYLIDDVLSYLISSILIVNSVVTVIFYMESLDARTVAVRTSIPTGIDSQKDTLLHMLSLIYLDCFQIVIIYTGKTLFA